MDAAPRVTFRAYALRGAAPAPSPRLSGRDAFLAPCSACPELCLCLGWFLGWFLCAPRSAPAPPAASSLCLFCAVPRPAVAAAGAFRYFVSPLGAPRNFFDFLEKNLNFKITLNLSKIVLLKRLRVTYI